MNAMWYGLKPDGGQISISHEALMEWAHRHEMQFQVGWSEAVTMPDGARLARTKAGAEAKGWADIAQAPFDEVPA